MSNLSADATLRILGEPTTQTWVMDTSSAQTIYKGCPVIIDQDVDTVYCVTAASVTVASGDVFLGIAAEQKTVTASAAETTEITLYVQPTIVGFKSTVFTNASCGDTVHMSDTATLSGSSGAYCAIGTLFLVKDGYAYVRLLSPTNQTGS